MNAYWVVMVVLGASIIVVTFLAFMVTYRDRLEDKTFEDLERQAINDHWKEEKEESERRESAVKLVK